MYYVKILETSRGNYHSLLYVMNHSSGKLSDTLGGSCPFLKIQTNENHHPKNKL